MGREVAHPPEDVEAPRLLTLWGAARFLGCPPPVVNRMIDDGEIAALDVGGRIRIHPDRLHDLLRGLGYIPSYVYLITGADKVKIGRSDYPCSRAKDLQAGSPVPLGLVRTIPTYAAVGLELHLHYRYRKHRAHGEWFDAAPVLEHIGRYDDIAVASWPRPRLVSYP